jgi:predicted MPP superfamily phosphohydrolase
MSSETVAERGPGNEQGERHAAPRSRKRRAAWTHPENWIKPYYLGTAIFRLLGLYNRGWINAHTVIHRPLTWRIPNLPGGLSGLRILYLSDLHLDGPSETTERLLGILPTVEADLTILGGDYRWHTFGSSEVCAGELARLVPALGRPYGLFGVLGNHDDPRFAGAMAAMGIRVLANEAQAVRFGEAELWLVGLEDSHLWLRDDLDGALEKVPAGATTLILSHSLELVWEAADRGAALYLAGHTHWGQIALPGGVPIITHATPGRGFARGFWHIGRMRGYTSSGAGVAGLPLRFNTQSELVTLTLRPA